MGVSACLKSFSSPFAVCLMHVFCMFVTDIDECALAAVTGLQACHGDAECRNTPGAFTCSCPAGYVMALNGQSCVGEVIGVWL